MQHSSPRSRDCTDRNYRLNYGPGLFDIRHVVHPSGTYDLPFGNGRHDLNQGGIVNGIVGGWTLGIQAIQIQQPANQQTGPCQQNAANSHLPR